MEKEKNKSHNHDHQCENCTCNHDHDHNHDHNHTDEHETVTLLLEDNTELVCPIIDIFDIEGQQYIVLLHPVEETALLYRFEEFEDGEIEIQNLEDHDEYELVSKKFLALQEQYELEESELGPQDQDEDYEYEDDDDYHDYDEDEDYFDDEEDYDDDEDYEEYDD